MKSVYRGALGAVTLAMLCTLPAQAQGTDSWAKSPAAAR